MANITDSINDLNEKVINTNLPKEIQEKAEKVSPLLGTLDSGRDVVNTVFSRAKQAREYRSTFEEEWRRAFKAWMQKLDTKAEIGWESKRFLPVILQHVESAFSAIIAIVFNGPRIWALRGLTPTGRDAATALEKLTNWQARGVSRLEPSAEMMFWWALTTGTGFIDIQWQNRRETKYKAMLVDEMNAQGENIKDANGANAQLKVVRPTETTVEDWPVCEWLHPLDVYANPWSEPGDDSDWFVQKMETTIGRLYAVADRGYIVKEALDAWIESDKPQDQSPDFESAYFGDMASGPSADDWMNDVGHNRRDDSAFDRDDKGLYDRPVVLMQYRGRGEKLLITPSGRIIGYAFTPNLHGKTGIVSHAFIPIPGSPYGRGLGTILLGHQELLNENINLFMDVSKVSLMAPIVVSRSQITVNDKNFRWQPNAIIWARDVNNAAKRMDVPAPTNLAMTLDAHLKKDADDTTGFNEQARGHASSTVNTATEFQGLQSNIRTRMVMHVRRLSHTVRCIGQMFVALNQQYMTKEQIITVVGEDGLDYVTVKPNEVVGEVVVQVDMAASRAAPAQRSQQMLGASQIVLPLLQQSGQLNPPMQRWVRALLESIEIEDVDRILPKNSMKMKSPMVENVALERGIKMVPNEMDNHQQHAQEHAAYLQELQAKTPNLDPSLVQAFLEHMDLHAQMEMAMAQQQMQGMAPGAQAQGNAPMPQAGGAPDAGRAQAQGLGAAHGSNGVPGAAAPGPAAPPGRAA